jgi:hypothetical protein
MGLAWRLGLHAADLEAEGLAGHAFEGRGVARGRPQLELGVAGGA